MCVYCNCVIKFINMFGGFQTQSRAELALSGSGGGGGSPPPDSGPVSAHVWLRPDRIATVYSMGGFPWSIDKLSRAQSAKTKAVPGYLLTACPVGFDHRPAARTPGGAQVASQEQTVVSGRPPSTMSAI